MPNPSRSEVAYLSITCAFVVVLVLTNIVGIKLFLLPPILGSESLTLTCGLITYPLTFLFTDVVSEIWGKRRAELMVVLGFVCSLLMLVIVQIAVVLPGSPVWVNGDLGFADVMEMQTAFESVFTLPSTLVLGSMTAYLLAQLLDVRLYHFWKRVTSGRHLWLRNNASTWVSQLVDTIVVNSIFLGWGMGVPWETVGEIIVSVYVCKLVLAALDTPLIYLVVSWLKNYLDLDVKKPSTA